MGAVDERELERSDQARRMGEQLRGDSRYDTQPIDADEREFWNAPLREAIRSGSMKPPLVYDAELAGEAGPDLTGRCQLCGHQTTETKCGAQFCRACEAPKPKPEPFHPNAADGTVCSCETCVWLRSQGYA